VLGIISVFLCISFSILLCGCKDKDSATSDTDEITVYNPPYIGTEGTPDEEGIIMGEDDSDEGSKVAPSLTAPGR
jgi:hypothetical protein